MVDVGLDGSHDVGHSLHGVGHEVEHAPELGSFAIVEVHLSLGGQQTEVAARRQVALDVLHGRVTARGVESKRGSTTKRFPDLKKH